jgi:hypothetical protein
MAIGQGGANSIADARNGIKTTEEPTRAVEMRGFGRNDESLAIPRIMNAIRAFQKLVSLREGTYQDVASRIPRAAVPTAANKSRKVSRSRSGWL